MLCNFNVQYGSLSMTHLSTNRESLKSSYGEDKSDEMLQGTEVEGSPGVHPIISQH